VSAGPLIALDLAALLLGLVGFHLAFRQRWTVNLWRRLNGRAPRATGPGEESPAHYGLIISGVMLMAFAAIIISLFSAFSLDTAHIRASQD
jgi:hypothetical protein